jgi:TonB family protein
MKEIPPMEVAPRAKTGFVQVEFEVGDDGVVKSAEVVNAVHPGVYEEQALRQVRNRRWAPDPRGQRTLTEVVRFSVPSRAEDGQDAGTSGLRE